MFFKQHNPNICLQKVCPRLSLESLFAYRPNPIVGIGSYYQCAVDKDGRLGFFDKGFNAQQHIIVVVDSHNRQWIYLTVTLYSLRQKTFHIILRQQTHLLAERFDFSA